MFVLTSWSFLMCSRALLAMMFANAVLCRVYVTTDLTCEQRSNSWWLVSGLLLFDVFKNVRVAMVVVILDVFRALCSQ